MQRKPAVLLQIVFVFMLLWRGHSARAQQCEESEPLGCSAHLGALVGENDLTRWITPAIATAYNLIFDSACIEHDLCYRHGAITYGFERSDCDRRFFNNMNAICREPGGMAGSILIPVVDCPTAAAAYYGAVSGAGGLFFKGPDESTCCAYTSARPLAQCDPVTKVEIWHMRGGGQGTLEYSNTLSAGWSEAEPYSVGSGNYVVWRKNDGVVDIDRLAGNESTPASLSNIVRLHAETGFSVLPFTVTASQGARSTFLLWLGLDGTVKVDATNADGTPRSEFVDQLQLPKTSSLPGFGFWTDVVAFRAGRASANGSVSGTYVMFKNAAGTLQLYAVRTDGSIGRHVNDYSVPSDWKMFSYEVNGRPYVLWVEGRSRNYRIDRIDPATGELGATYVQRGSLPRAYDTMVTYRVGTEHFAQWYDRSTGYTLITRLDGAGRVGAQVASDSLANGWRLSSLGTAGPPLVLWIRAGTRAE